MIHASPTVDGASVCESFGRAPSYVLYDDGAKTLRVIENVGSEAEHGAGTGAIALLAAAGVRSIKAPHLGPKAAGAAAAAGISVEHVDAGTSLETLFAGAART
ncbi:MAG TPA: NifB/NifX family molybdenum-iron cluster-binding protein [Spirochaetales bacterium]|nr:NifB/NifX family molybdenum-iron cluster-binding protein [Spirochaetales bacterium]